VAELVSIRLKGGPCDGRKATVKRTGDLLPGYTCEHVNYQPTGNVTKGGSVIYTTAESQKPKPAPATGPVAQPTSAHKAWHHMMHRVFVAAPQELHGAARARSGMRRLRHRPGLR
jgi:hypothetical protein